MYDTYVDMPMAITAENLAVKYKISREECDEFALQSQMKWKKGNLVQFRFCAFNIFIENINLLLTIKYLILFIHTYASSLFP